MSDKIQIRVLGPIPPHAKGDVVSVECDVEGTPLDIQWRRRLRDAETDNCCEVVRPPKRRRATRTTTATDADGEE